MQFNKKIRKVANYLQINSYLCTRKKRIKVMNVEFDNEALEELYTNGETADHQYNRLSKSVVKQYVKVVNYIRSVQRIEDLYRIKSLHYEKKGGDLNGVDVVWINDQYRLFFYSSPNETGIVVNALLFKISKHYGK